MVEYILENKEWIFSGIGVTLLSWLIFRNTGGSSKKRGQEKKGSGTFFLSGLTELQQHHQGLGSRLLCTAVAAIAAWPVATQICRKPSTTSPAA